MLTELSVSSVVIDRCTAIVTTAHLNDEGTDVDHFDVEFCQADLSLMVSRVVRGIGDILISTFEVVFACGHTTDDMRDGLAHAGGI